MQNIQVTIILFFILLIDWPLNHSLWDFFSSISQRSVFHQLIHNGDEKGKKYIHFKYCFAILNNILRLWIQCYVQGGQFKNCFLFQYSWTKNSMSVQGDQFKNCFLFYIPRLRVQCQYKVGNPNKAQQYLLYKYINRVFFQCLHLHPVHTIFIIYCKLIN